MNSTSSPLPGRTRSVLAVLRRNLRVWRKFMVSSLVGNLTEPFLYLLAMGYGLGSLVTEVEGVSYIQFIAPGVVVSATMYAATFEGTYGTYTRLAPQRTFESVLATPVGVGELVCGEILYATVKATAAGCAVLAVVSAFGLAHSPWVLLVPVLSLVSGFLFGGLSVLVSAASPSYDFFTYYFTLVITPLFLFSGIFFPLSQLPEWARTVAWFSPLTHAANLSRALFSGSLDPGLLTSVAWICMAALLPVYPAVLLIRRRLIT
jgi:lipooligosaccharide transport system permease protein